MSGLFVRSHMNAGQDGFRDKSSKQNGDLIEGHWKMRNVSHRGSIDHTICSRLRISRSETPTQHQGRLLLSKPKKPLPERDRQSVPAGGTAAGDTVRSSVNYNSRKINQD
jgi:hypothetical protein